MEKKTILIVDDKAENLYLLQALLQGNGFEVATASNGTEALDIARKNPPGLIISDILMPVMDGFTLCREWRKDPVLESIPFIFYTATYTDERDREFALSLGADRFIIKPQEPDVLIDMIMETKQGRTAPERGTTTTDSAESVYLKQYNETLIRKLEAKMEQLEKTNKKLEEDIIERTEASMALRHERDFSDAALNSLPGVFYCYDSNLKFLRWNKNFEHVTGYSAVEMADLTPLDFITGSDKMLLASRIKEVFEKGISDVEADFVAKDGTLTPYYFTGLSAEIDGRPCLIGVGIDISSRRKAEAELRESEEKYRLLVENAHEAIYVVQEGIIVFANAAFARMTEMDISEPVGRSMLEFAHPDEHPKVHEHHLKISNCGKDDIPFEVKAHTAKGKELWVSVNAVHIAWKGKPATLNFATDITEHKLSEKVLQESEERYRLLFDTSMDAILLTAPDGRIFAANRAACQIFGRSEEEIMRLGRNGIADISDPRLAPAIEERNRTGRFTGELIMLRKDGSKFPTEISSSLFMDNDRQLRASMIIRDVSDRKKAEETIKESEATFRTTVETSPLAIAISRGNEQIHEYLNPKFVELFGYNMGDIPDLEHWLTLAYPDEQYRRQLVEEWQSRVRRAIGTKSNIEPMESVVTCKDGSRKNILWGFIPMEKRNYAYGLDLTAHKQAEKDKEKLQEQLNQAQKMESIGRLAGGVAHDFNNMLTAILGHTEMAMDKSGSDQGLLEDLKEIKKAAEHSADLTRQLLAFARKQTVMPQVQDLNTTVENMLKMLRRLIGEDIELLWMPEKELWPVKIDSSQLKQILTNLCLNARDAITGVGKLTIKTENTIIDEAYSRTLDEVFPGKYVMLAVSDTGCGMDKETLCNIFEPFFTTKEVGKGTGMGLPTVYGIVKQNNGFISVNTEQGKGTVFKIHLPMHIGKDEQLQAQKAPGASVTKGNETILLVEDERTILNMTRKMLESLGYNVLSADTPCGAIRMAEEHAGDIHLLLTDVVMPEMNGRDLARKLLPLYPDIKRLFMSGYTANIIASHGVLDGGVHFIQKPFSISSLSEKVRAALDGE